MLGLGDGRQEARGRGERKTEVQQPATDSHLVSISSLAMRCPPPLSPPSLLMSRDLRGHRLTPTPHASPMTCHHFLGRSANQAC